MTLELNWKFNNLPLGDIGSAVTRTVIQMVYEQFPDLADMFPFQTNHDTFGFFDESWMVFRVSGRHGSGIPVCGPMKDEELAEIKEKVLPFSHRSYMELYQLLGAKWYSFNRFTYVGPYKDSAGCWPDVHEHLVDWLNHIVLPEVERRNRTRVLRAIPNPPQFNLSAIKQALWVLECDETCKQGTAFALANVGLITCHHALGSKTKAFKADNPSQKFQVNITNCNETIDLAILNMEHPVVDSLAAGSADHLNEMDHIAVAGFPNYRMGDSGVIIPGLVVGFRTVSSIRRILTNANIIAGNSGGPVLDSNNRVVGVAVTGADRMEDAPETENHGIIPIDALRFLL